KTAAQYSIETLQLHFNLLLKGAEEMQYSSHPRLVLEMTLIRAAEAGNIVPVTQLLEKLEGMQGNASAAPESNIPRPQAPTPRPAVKEKVHKKTGPQIVPPNIPEEPVQQKKTEKTELEKKEKVIEIEKQENKEPVTSQPATVEESLNGTVAEPLTKEVRKNWDEFIEYVMDRKKWMAHTLRLCSNVRVEGTDLVLKFDDPSDCKVLQTKENIKFLTEFSQDFFQKEFKICIKIRGTDVNGVINHDGNGPQEERRALANDPLVQMATEVLGGRVANIRTGPRSR
ncbi:hypothetical protein ACFLZ5_11285, partial [Thermodesulfobacteriota bacterium]